MTPILKVSRGRCVTVCSRVLINVLFESGPRPEFLRPPLSLLFRSCRRRKDLPQRLVVQGDVGPLMSIKLEVRSQTGLQLQHRPVILQVHVLALHAPPQSLDVHVVQRTAAMSCAAGRANSASRNPRRRTATRAKSSLGRWGIWKTTARAWTTRVFAERALPVATVWMESLVKEINDRVKGTEMFWNDPEGAEAILQVRAAALSDDDRLIRHLQTRPGCSFTRRPKPRKLSAETCNS